MDRHTGSLPSGRFVRLVLACHVLAVVLVAPARAQTGTFVVNGRVTERGQGTPVANATVLLGEDHRAVTDSTGRFEVRGVRPGRYALTVEAFGYRTAQTSISVFQDVEGTVQLDPQPVALDTIAVQPRRFNLRGRVLDAESGRSVPYVTITVGAATTSATDAGTFRIRDLAAGPHTVSIEGYGFLPARTTVDLESDTIVTFRLEPDPITQRIIAAQIERIETRSSSVGYARTFIGREEILESRAASPVDIISSRAAVRIRDCVDPGAQERQLNLPMSSISICVEVRGATYRPMVYIDDRQVCGLEFLSVYANSLLQHIEVFSGGRVVRAYTARFIENLAAQRESLRPLALLDSPIRC